MSTSTQNKKLNLCKHYNAQSIFTAMQQIWLNVRERSILPVLNGGGVSLVVVDGIGKHCLQGWSLHS